MEFFQQLAAFFKTLFTPSGPESIKQQQLKRIEINLSKMEPPFYKNGEVQIIVAESLFLLYKNTSVLHQILDFMGSAKDARLKARMFDALIQTGYSEKSKKILDSLTYEKRKEKLEDCQDKSRETEAQRHAFLELQKELKLGSFVQIEHTLQNLELFYDLCSFNFFSVLKIFSPTFDSMDETSSFSPVPIEELNTTFLELYYITAKLELTGSLARAIIALLTIVSGKSKLCSPDDIVQNIRKISTVINKILTPAILKDLIAVGKNDDSIEPEFAVIKSTPIEDYIVRERARFQADEPKLKDELQNQQRNREIKNLFGEQALFSLQGYDSVHNETLKGGSAVSFLWILPMQLIKTFLTLYFEQQVRGLLNDIVLEGFFYSPEKKTEFSSTIFACLDIDRSLKEFEDSFDRNGKNDVVLVLSYLKDSQKDENFSRNLASMVNAINDDAKNFIQTQVSYLYDLYKLILQLSEDSRKNTPETVSNIKFLFTSSRNRGRVGFLEKALPKWAAFLTLMKNYASIGQIEVSREETRQQSQFSEEKL